MSTPAPTILSTREGYDLWAGIYDGEGNPLIALEEPVVDQLMGDVRGLRVADIGCGTGRHAVQLASRGASVTAVDFSDGMLAQARTKPGAERVKFIVHDITKRLPLEDAAYNRVLCALVLDHIHDVSALFGELRRICAPDGRIVVSVMHPAMMLKGVQARFTDPQTGIETRPMSAPNQISDYINAVMTCGLTLDHFSEHAVDDALAAKMQRAVKHMGWPLLLAMRMLVK